MRVLEFRVAPHLFFKTHFNRMKLIRSIPGLNPDEPAAEQSDKENNDDESIIDKVVSQEVQSGDETAPTPSANRSRKFLDSSSDESDAAEATPSRDKEKKRVKKSFLDSRSGH